MGNSEIKKAEKKVARGRGEDTRGLPTYIPQVDIYENKEAVTVMADMPGVSRGGVGGGGRG